MEGGLRKSENSKAEAEDRDVDKDQFVIDGLGDQCGSGIHGSCHAIRLHHNFRSSVPTSRYRLPRLQWLPVQILTQ